MGMATCYVRTYVRAPDCRYRMTQIRGTLRRSGAEGCRTPAFVSSFAPLAVYAWRGNCVALQVDSPFYKTAHPVTRACEMWQIA